MGYVLEKAIWTDADFEVMGWHDATLHALAVRQDDYRLLFDLDYIFKWVHPSPPEQNFSFWVAPVTLVFEGVQAIKIDLSCTYIESFTLQGLERSDPRPMATPSLLDWAWRLECNEGEITFRAHGFAQFVRLPPMFSSRQTLTLEERGEISVALPEHLRRPQ